MALPEILCDPVKGPLIKLRSPDGLTTKSLTLNDEGEFLVDGFVPGIKDISNENFNPTNGQTVFTLSTSTGGGSFSILFVNGIEYLTTLDYTISGTTLTWLDTGFTLEVGDIVDVFYETA